MFLLVGPTYRSVPGSLSYEYREQGKYATGAEGNKKTGPDTAMSFSLSVLATGSVFIFRQGRQTTVGLLEKSATPNMGYRRH